MKVAVVKYNAGNIRSVDYALKRLGVEAVITADKEELQSADKVIFPGEPAQQNSFHRIIRKTESRFVSGDTDTSKK